MENELDLEKFKNRIIHRKIIQKREGTYIDFPEKLHDEIKTNLASKGIKQLYGHQVEMFNKSQNGENIVITTSTASGKTLSFLLPVLNRILNKPSTRAIFIYPTKALASDQLKSILPIIEFFGKDKINIGIYDGDTPPNERGRIRKEANIILTNPEMVNSAFLPHHSKFGFEYIFKNLEFVVIDELHYYRGAFGSHIANVLRRLKRISKYYNSIPQFFCSTATIANPIELAENIFNEKFCLVNNDCSPCAEKEVIFWLPPGNRFVQSEATDLIPESVMQEYKFIAFSQSRRELEVILKEVRERLSQKDIGNRNHSYKDSSNLISGYRGGYRPEERKEIERELANGNLKGVIATNALELGIDIGSIDLVISAGFPKTKASFFQQIGRAGRRGSKSYAVLILNLRNTYDQFIAASPDWLFNSSIENAIIDKNNLFIQIAHVRAASAELPLTLDDLGLFPDLGEILPVLLNKKELIKNNGRFTWNGKEFPAGDYSLRAITSNRYKIINKQNNEVLSEMDEAQAFKEIFKNAIYLHNGESYLVENLDLINRLAIAIPVNYNYYTVPFALKDIKVINILKEVKTNCTKKYFGDVKVSITNAMFKKLQFHNFQNVGSEDIDPPLTIAFETEAIWVEEPQKVKIYFENIMKATAPGEVPRYYEGIGEAFLNAFMIRTMTTNNDVGCHVFLDLNKENEKVRNIAIYDNYTGGLGFAEKGYELLREIISEAHFIVKECRCTAGCPACTGVDRIDKKVILWAILSFLEEAVEPTNFEITKTNIKPHLEKKPFLIEDLSSKWGEFKELLKKDFNGAFMSGFLQTIDTVNFENNEVSLISDQHISLELFSSDENQSAIVGHIDRFFESKQKFKIKLSSKKKNDENTEKIQRRHNDLLK